MGLVDFEIKAGKTYGLDGVGQVVAQRVLGNGYVRVMEQNGQMYEVMERELKQVETTTTTSESAGNTQSGTQSEKVDWESTKVGDDVNVDNHDYKVADKTQRSITLSNGQVKKMSKQEFLEKAVKGKQNSQNSQGNSQASSQDENTKPETTQDNKATDEQTRDGAKQIYDLLKLQQALEKKISDSVDDELKEIKEIAKSKRTLEIKLGDQIVKIEGTTHKQFEILLTYVGLNLNPLLVGMAGTGKTHTAHQVAKALGLDFYSISVGAQTTKTDIMGYMDANGNYVATGFRKAYENGGVFLMDEIDAGNSNVLIALNSALSNGIGAFADKMVERHPDFRFIATANTYGNGANRQYVGRNQLDSATLDRFAVIDWNVDEKVEDSLAIGRYGTAWVKAVRAGRKYVEQHAVRALISPRATQKGSSLLEAGIVVEQVIESVVLPQVQDDKKNDLKKIILDEFNKHTSEVSSDVSDLLAQ